MKKVLIGVLILLALPLGYWAWAEFIRDPREAIIAELKSIASLAEFDSNTELFRHTGNIAKLCSYFASDVVVHIDAPEEDLSDINGRVDLEMKLRSTVKIGGGLKVEFVDIVVDVGAANRSALVNLTLKAHFLDDADEMIAHELKLTMKKSSGKWLITRVESVKALRP